MVVHGSNDNLFYTPAPVSATLLHVHRVQPAAPFKYSLGYTNGPGPRPNRITACGGDLVLVAARGCLLMAQIIYIYLSCMMRQRYVVNSSKKCLRPAPAIGLLDLRTPGAEPVVPESRRNTNLAARASRSEVHGSPAIQFTSLSLEQHTALARSPTLFMAGGLQS